MKRFGVSIFILSLCVGCAAMAARNKAVNEARQACHDLPPSTVYSEMYAVLSGKYEITRESERRGVIETQWKEEESWGIKKRSRVNAEIVGEKCLRVVLKASLETHTNDKWTHADGSGVEDDLYVEIHRRLDQRRTVAVPAPAPATPATSTPPPEKSAVGTERGPCYGNGTCNQGLACASNVCVRLPSSKPAGGD